LVTMLNEKGVPTPLVHTMLYPPRSRMDILTGAEIENIVAHSKLVTKYNQAVDSESAYEILNGKLQQATQQAQQQKEMQQQKTSVKGKKEDSFFDNPVVKQAERTAASVLTRSLLGVLGLGGRRKSIF
jgi:hypothetical protein